MPSTTTRSTSSSTTTTKKSSTRWCPTPEQVMILEEIYRSGTRTPSATQIQQITAHLSLYGKIQGKNVFYWFQNHKARERLNMRSRIISKHHPNYQRHQHNNIILPRFILSPPCSAATVTYTTNPKIDDIGVLLSQEGVSGSPTTQMMNHYKWKMDTPEKIDMKKSSIKMQGEDQTMMMAANVGSSSSSTTVCCTLRPLITLNLFPTTPTNLKQ